MKKYFNKYPKLILALFIFCLFIGVFILYINKPGQSELFIRCPFYLITSLYCPGCGTTRALYSLLHLDFYSAIRCNFITVICVPFVGYQLLALIVNTYSKKDLLPYIKFSKTISIIIIILIMLFFVLRNLPVKPFTFLAPINLN